MDGSSSHVPLPPGFRFHPTDEELVDYYLRKKVASNKIDFDIIRDVDLYKIEPWDLQEKCKIGMQEQSEWYFFSHKDKKYPTGTRTNRATTAGFWKATGRDKPIYTNNCLVGMRKTLVFYRGRAPNGQKSDWIMHEYRLETTENATAPEEGWVVCRVFKKRVAMVQRMADSSPCWFVDDHVAGFMPALGSPGQLVHHHHPNAAYGGHQQLYHCKPELEYHHLLPSQEAFLPQLESPKPPAYIGHGSGSLQTSDEPASRYTAAQQQTLETGYMAAVDDSTTDWRVLDKFVASQLFNHGDGTSKEPGYSNPMPLFQLAESSKREETLDYASTSASGGGESDLWK
ncbi:hypothetical protein QOZ80_2BG0194690 [Eleusine coracana subsp. coracana]|nr:hypothetical protein QOZ80_2BG0194690 [Eleusine coracana subsp. coracana]